MYNKQSNSYYSDTMIFINRRSCLGSDLDSYKVKKHAFTSKINAYLYGSLHDNGGGIVNAFGAQVEHGVVTLIFGFCYVLIYFLKRKKTLLSFLYNYLRTLIII